MRPASVSRPVPIALLIISETMPACLRTCAGLSKLTPGMHPGIAATAAAASIAHQAARGASLVMLPVSTRVPVMPEHNGPDPPPM
jgi:hypothetical protein